MSDRRRRRINDEGEDDNADTDAKPRGERPSECESEEESGDVGDLSETESTADDGTEKEDDETEEGTDTETEGSYTEGATDSETETEEGEYTDEEDEGLDGERQSGDGEEQPEDETPDDDEDRKNPAYVPRKGAFYEHDSRDGLEEGEDEKGEVTEQKKLKKLWQEESKWGHDYYREDMQAPKSREELMTLYGYDILAADEAPEAPPMVKRGRGRGRKRDTQFKDYLPRMAVIDTTEYGTDAVPTLDEDGLITYRDSKPARSSRGRGSTTTYGGRGGGGGNNRYQGRDNTDNYSRGNRDDRYNNKPPQREASGNTVQGSQDARNYDFPSLGEAQRGGRSNNSRGQGRDFPQQYGSQSNREHQEQSNNYNYDRNRRSGGSARFNNNNLDEDNNSNYQRRGGDRTGGSNYPSRNNEGRNFGGSGRRFGDGDGSGGYNQNYGDNSGANRYNNNRNNDRRDNFFGRGQDNDSRQMENNWRSDPTVGDNNRRVYQDQRGGRGRGRGDAGGRPRPYDGGDDYGHRAGYSNQKKFSQQEDSIAMAKRPSRTGYDNVPSRYQQQQPEHIDSREYTSSKMSGGNISSGVGPSDNRTVSSSSAQGSGAPNESSSNNVVISNKENVQTINVTITSTTTEKKSYAKERRAKGAGAATIPKAGDPQHGSPAMVTDGKMDVPGKQYPPPTVAGVSSNLPSVPGGGAKRYSSQRQQQQAVVAPKTTGYNATAPTGEKKPSGASTLYNPAMPPPTFFQHDSSTSSGNQAPPPPTTGQDPQQMGFNPSILPPGNPALSFGLPVPTPGLPIPTAPTGSPNIFQGPPVSIGGPPPPAATGPPLMGPPFITPGMMYGTSPTPNPRVPPPATPVGFPIPIAAYPTGPPPPTPNQPPSNVVPPPVSQGATNSVPGSQQLPTKPKKVYRGDITYYAPELQQPARTTQKRPKSAIPIVDPQEISQMKSIEKLEEDQAQDQSRQSPQQFQVPEGSTATTTGVDLSIKEELISASSGMAHPKDIPVLSEEQGGASLSVSNTSGSRTESGTNNGVVNTSVPTTSYSQDEKSVVSAMADLSLSTQEHSHPLPTAERSGGDAGRFIKGKSSSSELTVVDNRNSVKQQESLSTSDGQSSSNMSKDCQSTSEIVVVQEEIAS